MTCSKMLLAVLVLMMAQSLALAQTTQPFAAPAGTGLSSQLHRLTEAVRSLKLDASQRAQVKEILANFRQQLSSFKETAKTATPQQRREQVVTLLKNLRQQLAQVLSPAEEKHLAKETGKGEGAGKGEGLAMLRRLRADLAELHLTAAQRKEVAGVMRNATATARQLMQEHREGEKVRDQVKQLREEIHTKLKAILTPEQMKQLHEKMAEPAGAGSV